MASLLRIEFTGVLYHVTAHGNARESIDRDRCKLSQSLIFSKKYLYKSLN